MIVITLGSYPAVWVTSYVKPNLIVQMNSTAR